MGLIYLDHLAATPLHPRVKEAMIHHIDTVFDNPSSDHQVGQPAGQALELARERVAALINAEPKEVVFTSGGTESNNHALKGIAIGLREKGHPFFFQCTPEKVDISAEFLRCLLRKFNRDKRCVIKGEEEGRRRACQIVDTRPFIAPANLCTICNDVL